MHQTDTVRTVVNREHSFLRHLKKFLYLSWQIIHV